MKKIYLASLFLFLLSPAIGQVVINSLASPYTQDFNTLSNAGTSSTLPPGWFLAETGTGANDTYNSDNGGLNAGNTYSYGVSASTERAFGSLQSGAVIPIIGGGFSNNTGATITSLTINYFGEQWRTGAPTRLDTLNFQYSTDATSLITGTYLDVNELDFLTPNTTGSTGALDGNATANRTNITFTINGLSIASGTSFYLRWVDGNVSGSDDGLAIDDLTITFNGANLPPCSTPAAQPSNLSFSNVSNTSITGNFIAPSPAADKYLVIISPGSSLTALPQNGTSYNVDDVIGNGTVVTATNGSSFTASSLNPGTTYYFYIFSFNSNCTGGPLYNTTAPLTGSSTTTVPPVCVAPVSAPGAITTNASGTSINGSFVAASDADGYLAIRSTNSGFTFTPVNGTSYAVGQTVGTSGTVIKYSAGNTFATNGLTTNTTYYFFVYSVNNFTCSGGPLYNTTPSTANATTTNSATGEPPTYYNDAAGKSCNVLKTALKTIITNGMTPRSYGDLWNQYLVSDVKPRERGPGTSTNVIWDIYTDIPNALDSFNFNPGGSGYAGQCGNYSVEGDCYNREHSFPQDWFTGGTSTGPGTDFHHIFPTDGKVNGNRASYVYGEVATPSYTSTNGSKLGSSSVSGISGPVFEPINEYKGDVARAFLYMVTRYEDNMPSWGSFNSFGQQALAPNTYPSVDIPYLQLMIKWHSQDAVSQKEIDRNNSAFAFQRNRNPYVDHPEYVGLVWNNTCSGLSTLPVDIISFGGKLAGEKVILEWVAANEINFDRFEIERSFNGTTFENIGEVKAANLRNYTFSDNANSLRGRRVYYRLKKVDKDGRSKYSNVFNLHIPFNTKFTVYPNPASNYVQLQLNRNVNGKVVVQVTDISGKVLLQQTGALSGNNIRVNTASLSNGTYLVKLTYNGEQYVQKVMIAK